jgi:tetratricopeptide (TPR) repeat protein
MKTKASRKKLEKKRQILLFCNLLNNSKIMSILLLFSCLCLIFYKIMNVLKEISTLSTYQPLAGDILLMFELMIGTERLTRKEALAVFKKKNKSEARFRIVYKELKERLIGGIFSNSFPDFTTVQKAHYTIWKNEAAVKISALRGKRQLSNKLGHETFNMAIKYGEFDAALSMAKILISHYSIIETDAKKYYFFKSKIKELRKKIEEEGMAHNLNLEMIFRIRKNLNMDGIKEQLNELDKIAQTNKEHRFNLYYFNARSYYSQVMNDQPSVIKNAEAAIRFFERFEVPLPYATSYAFYTKLAVIFINQKEYAKAEDYLNRCLKLPTKGSYNWNITLFLIAILGFHSNHPEMAYKAWRKAESQPKKFKSDVIQERWRIILAYLVWYKKIGRIDIEEDYRLGKFLNEMDVLGKNKSGQNVSVIVAQMLHYLVDKRFDDFETKACRLEKYITTYLRKKEHIRSKNFLRALRNIEDANYYLKQAEQRTKRYWNNIQEVSLTVSLDLLESEVVPFELTWGEITKLLK